MTTIVDTDAILAVSNPTDALHERAKQMVERMGDAAVLLSPTTLAEFSLIGPRQLGLARARAVIHTLTGGNMRIARVNEQDVHAATQLFDKQRRIDNSLCDCFVMVVAQRIKADCIFSFDRGYPQNGFVLIEDFLQQHSA